MYCRSLPVRVLGLASFVAFVACVTSPTFGQYSKHVGQGYNGGGYSGGGYSGGGYGGFPYGNTASSNPGLGRPSNLSLVVAQTQQGHEGVADLLNQLRRMQDQQVVNQVRFNTLNDSFYERMGVNFGFNLRGANPAGGRGVVGLDPTGQPTSSGDIQFRQGGAFSATPPFGGHDPASDGSVGFANRGSEGDMLFNFFGGQGNTRSMVTQAPSVVVPNGGRGTISDTSQVPFVTGVIPVVGAPSLAAITGYGVPHAPPQQSVIQQRLQQLRYDQIRQASQRQASTKLDSAGNARAQSSNALHLSGTGGSKGPSSADRGDMSIAEIRRMQASTTDAEDSETLALIERARGAEAAGKDNVAKIYYKMAARRAEGPRKQQLIEKVRQLNGQ